MPDDSLAFEGFHHGEADGTGERGSVPGVPRREGTRAGGEGVVDMLAAERRPDRRITGSETLGGRDDVRDERQVLGGEPTSRATHARDDLVEANEEAVPLTALRKPLPEAVGGLERRQGRAADRLAEERGDRVRAGLV